MPSEGSRASRWLASALVVAAAVAVVLVVSLERDEEPSPVDEPERAEHADYYFEAFTTYTYREDGRPHARLRGVDAYHFPERGELEITEPRLRVRTEGGAVWRARAPFGVARQSDETVFLQEEVHARRAAHGDRPRVLIDTRNLLIRLAEDRADTEEHAVAREPAGRIAGVGMTLFFEEDYLELHDEARGHYTFR